MHYNLCMPGISNIVAQSPYVGLFLLLVLGGLGLPFPEDTTLILGGFLISNGTVRPLPAILVLYAGLLVTDAGLFFAGKKYGRLIVTHRRFQKILSPEKLAALEEKFNKYGLIVILIGRHLIGLRAQLFLAAGVMRMSFLKFLAADAVSSLFTMAAMIGAGYQGGKSLEIIKKDMSRIEHVAIFVVVVLLALSFLYLYFRYRRNSDR